MFWLALHLPLLSLEAYCAGLPPEAAARPIALVAGHAISAVNAAAARCGIRPGLKRPTALALAADLQLAQADPARDAAALEAVVHVALAFTPSVTGHDAQTVLLEVQSSLRLFGGPQALVQRLQQALAPLGHRVQMAAAPTALGAALLARWHPPQHPLSRTALGWAHGPHTTELAELQRVLDGAPVHLLGPGQEHWDALQGMGLHTLSDLRQLPRSGLARRFGEDLLDDLDRAFGLQADPRRWTVPPASFEARLELLARADTTEQVLFGAGVLLARLVAWAQARQSRVAAFTLAMHHERRHRDDAPPATTLQVQLAEPALDPAHLQLLLRERLGHAVLAAPTLELRLHCSHLVQSGPPNGELFPTRGSQAEGLTRLLERLRARLGDAQVLRLQPVADHRPERASLAVPVQRLPAPDAARAAAAPAGMLSTLPLHRPVWLLPDPLALPERDALPLLDGRPLRLLSGPERIETGWWDGDPAVRDYFIAQAADGSLVWVWRGRLPAQPGEVNWFLQGRFG
jgi:protein ImuB